MPLFPTSTAVIIKSKTLDLRETFSVFHCYDLISYTIKSPNQAYSCAPHVRIMKTCWILSRLVCVNWNDRVLVPSFYLRSRLHWLFMGNDFAIFSHWWRLMLIVLADQYLVGFCANIHKGCYLPSLPVALCAGFDTAVLLVSQDK